MTCMDGGCYRHEKHCDGYNDCVDGSDEIGCKFFFSIVFILVLQKLLLIH